MQNSQRRGLTKVISCYLIRLSVCSSKLEFRGCWPLLHLPLRLSEIGRCEHFDQCLEANYSLHASVAVLQLRYSCLEIEEVELEALEGVAMVFELFAVAQLQTIYFDTLGRIGDVWGIYGLLGAHKGLLLCHLGAALCVMCIVVRYSGSCTLAILELLAISAVSFGSLDFLACCLFGFSKLA